MRATFVGALLVFCGASLIGAAAPTIGVMIAVRVVQGAAAGLVQPLGMVLVFESFAPHERGKGFGVYGLGVVLGPAIAPMIGGFMVDFWSWRGVFLVALPTCLAAAAFARMHLRGRRPDAAPRRLDIAGLALLGGSLAVLLWALARGPQAGWSDPAVAGGLLAGAAGAVVFAVWQWFCPAPLLDLRAFRSGGFVGGFLSVVMIGVGLYASTYLIPLFLQQGRAMGASDAGLVLLPGGLAMALTFPLAGQLTDRMAPAAVAAIGVALFLGSCLALAGAVASGAVLWLLVWVMVGRIGLGLMMPPVSAGSLRLLPPQLTAQGSGAMNFGRQLGGALGVGFISVVLDLGGYRAAFLALAAAFAVTLLPLWLMHRRA
jgi:DHA2 family multidrug resistance protein